MFWTGINGTELLGRMFKATGCLAAVAIMLISSGCTGAGQIRKSRLVKACLLYTSPSPRDS